MPFGLRKLSIIGTKNIVLVVQGLKFQSEQITFYVKTGCYTQKGGKNVLKIVNIG